MGVASLFYIAILYAAELYTEIYISNVVHNIIAGGLTFTATVFFYTAWWHIRNAATYEAIITTKEFSVSYPEVSSLSFCVNIIDINKIENRQSHSHAGKSILDTELVMNNGDFHKISMNYGNNIHEMFEVLESVNPNISFPNTVKTDYRLFGNK